MVCFCELIDSLIRMKRSVGQLHWTQSSHIVWDHVMWSMCHSGCLVILFLLWIVRIRTEKCRLIDLFFVFLQIATFFSNNLDFFTSPAYSPKGSTVALSPLQAESMLANKKKASAYIHAIKKVRRLNEMLYFALQKWLNYLLTTCFWIWWNQLPLSLQKTIPDGSPQLCLVFSRFFSPGHSRFHTAKPWRTVVFSRAPPRAGKVSLSRYVNTSKNSFQNPFQRIRIDLCKGHVSFLWNRSDVAGGYSSALIELWTK